MSDQFELIESPLSGTFSDEGLTVDVRICRIPTEDWSLEIVDGQGNSVVWDELFATDEEAYSEFIDDVEVEGLGGILDGVEE